MDFSSFWLLAAAVHGWLLGSPVQDAVTPCPDTFARSTVLPIFFVSRGLHPGLASGVKISLPMRNFGNWV